MENSTFNNNCVNFSLNVTTFRMLIDIVVIDKARDFGGYGNYFGVKLQSRIINIAEYLSKLSSFFQ